MSGVRRIGLIVLVLATLAIAAAPDLITLPRPTDAVVVDRATLVVDGQPDAEVSLPHVVWPGVGSSTHARYHVDIASSALPEVDPALYVPLVNRRLVVQVDGATVYDSANHVVWTGLAIGTPLLVRLPLPAGRPSYRLTLVIEVGPFATPTYLSRLYLGRAGALAPAFKVREFVDIDLKAMSLAVQVLLGMAVLLAWFVRPRTALLSWLAVFMALTIVIDLAMFMGFHASFRAALPYVVALVPAWGLLAAILSLLLIGLPPSRLLLFGIVAISVVLLGCALVGTPVARMIGAGTAAVFLCIGALAATGIIAWGALWRGNVDARLMLAPAVLTSWFLVRDAYVATTLPADAFRLYSPHAGLLYVVGLTAVLVRRMADSFDRLDRSNEVLNARLAAREAELAALAKQERIEAARLVREQERGRLTRDLHDGISGHLVSIIALSERAEERPIEQAARDALNDLRLVIYSLDVGEDELPLALANFRERLEPQLQRLGVALDWSMANLPDVAGVTPGKALAVLRIVQEAITNALKHGPARRIGVRGGALADGSPAIAIDNDGRPFAADSRGRGLDNMRRRAELLGATLAFETLSCGTRVVVALPSRLPDLEN
ncbi:sensor histidine kinase [Reyranella soli]|uniref:histidine kinase n=1 Tax=Reyranella soli TaxID=1230389 RepID=A0A512NMA1_9HYPH|nr:histidine kinase [Reyranella soli]GEP60049.1 histidine kinase [Reyranella soli]